MHFWAVRKVAHHFIPLSCLSPSLNLSPVTQTLKKSSLFCKIFALCQVSLLVECPQVYWAAELHLVLDTWGPLCLLAPPRRPARDFTNAQTHNTKRQNNKTRTKISHCWWLESNNKNNTEAMVKMGWTGEQWKWHEWFFFVKSGTRCQSRSLSCQSIKKANHNQQ